MPELPEVETLRSDLSSLVLGEEISAVSVTNRRSIRAHTSAEEFSLPLLGSTIVAISRKGKFLSFTLSPQKGKRFALVAHMGMSGQMRSFAADDDLPNHSHIRLELASGSCLVFVDPRTFGQMYLDELDHFGLAASLARLGVDPLNQPELVGRAVERYFLSGVGVKWLMLDQSIICGIGNMYADEILFRSHLRFDRPGRSLGSRERSELACAIPEVLNEAVALRGSSLRDLQYRDVNGAIGRYQELHLAYGREGQECLRCNGLIERIFLKGRSSFLCRSCQW